MTNLIPGPQVYPEDELEFFNSQQREKKKVLVYFLGGITYAEIAAIRFLND